MSDYNGWKNRQTWNCALWLENTESIYKNAQEFMADYKGKRPYIDFMRDCGLDEQRTGDNIKWCSDELDYKALNQVMWELKT